MLHIQCTILEGEGGGVGIHAHKINIHGHTSATNFRQTAVILSKCYANLTCVHINFQENGC